VTGRGSSVPEAWLIHFFQRRSDDDVAEATPTTKYLDSVPTIVAAEFDAILTAVAEAPPPSFSGGGKWEAMHGDMAGIYEVRVKSGGVNYRLFCLLVRTADKLEGPSIVCLDGLTKPARTAAQPREYARIRQYVAEFRKHGKVLR
jgi:hypothetical protein